MQFFIVTNSFSYLIKKEKSDITINNKDINLDIKYINPDEKKDVVDLYNQLIADGCTAKYAESKATLYFADYIEIGEPATIEFLDTLILYLADIIKIPVKINEKYNKINIYITDTYIKSKNEFEFNPFQSCVIPYNYKKLLTAILADYA